MKIKDLILDAIREQESPELQRPAKKGFFLKKPALYSWRKPSLPQVRLVTEDEVRSWVRAGQRRVFLTKGTLLTPLARELAQEKDLEVRFD